MLYFTPAITTIVNLNDRSFQISPEAAYTGFTNFDLRLKASFISGPTNSEFGKKPYDFKLALKVGYYFLVRHSHAIRRDAAPDSRSRAGSPVI